MVWLAVAILGAAVGITAWIIARASRAGTGVLLAASAGFALLWLIGLVNFLRLGDPLMPSLRAGATA
jgi:hypothetical protein